MVPDCLVETNALFKRPLMWRKCINWQLPFGGIRSETCAVGENKKQKKVGHPASGSFDSFHWKRCTSCIAPDPSISSQGLLDNPHTCRKFALQESTGTDET